MPREVKRARGFPGSSAGKESACNVGDLGSSPGLGRSRAWQPTPAFLPGKSPWTEEPGRLQSMGLQRVGHEGVTKHSRIQYDINALFYLPSKSVKGIKNSIFKKVE